MPASLRNRLDASLAAAFECERNVLTEVVEAHTDARACAALAEACRSVLRESFGMSERDTEALVRLSTSLPPRTPGMAPMDALVERCALQRALAADGRAGAVAPYLRAIAQGAHAGLSLDGDLLLDPNEGVQVPILRGPPIVNQRGFAGEASESKLFERRWDEL